LQWLAAIGAFVGTHFPRFCYLAERTTADYFANKRVVLFGIPGAFTPTCSTTHLPGYEAAYDTIKRLGIDEVYCLSVNDVRFYCENA
jgi:peroxiredoxin